MTQPTKMKMTMNGLLHNALVAVVVAVAVAPHPSLERENMPLIFRLTLKAIFSSLTGSGLLISLGGIGFPLLPVPEGEEGGHDHKQGHDAKGDDAAGLHVVKFVVLPRFLPLYLAMLRESFCHPHRILISRQRFRVSLARTINQRERGMHAFSLTHQKR